MKRVLYAGVAAFVLLMSALGVLATQERVNQPHDPVPLPFTVRGVGKLTGGSARVALGQDFEGQSDLSMRSVMLTCKGTGSLLWASEVRDGHFTVQTDARGNPSQEFWWEVTAARNMRNR